MRTGFAGIAALTLAMTLPAVAQTPTSPDRSAPAASSTTEGSRAMPGAGAGAGLGAGTGAGAGAGMGAGTGAGSAAGGAPVNEFKVERDKLEQVLSGAKQRADYASLLEKEGYKIASVNDDKPGLLEYEVVKGDKSYEVRLRFDEGDTVAKRIDITGNMWKAKETKEMLKQSKGEPGSETTAGQAADKPR